MTHICSGLPFEYVIIVPKGDHQGHFPYPETRHDNLTPERARALALTHMAPRIDALQNQL